MMVYCTTNLLSYNLRCNFNWELVEIFEHSVFHNKETIIKTPLILASAVLTSFCGDTKKFSTFLLDKLVLSEVAVFPIFGNKPY